LGTLRYGLDILGGITVTSLSDTEGA
jgi:hypothetical protein